MLRTRVGYAGGSKQGPTYRDLGDHTESFQVDFDPARIPFERLLEEFWSAHDPTAGSYCAQYAAILFVHDDRQERLAKESKARLEERIGTRVATEIRRLDRFWNAEDYHQKYALRSARGVMVSLRALFPDEASFRESTAAAKVNAHLAGDLSLEDLRRELDALGLRAEGGTRLAGVSRADTPVAATK